MIRFSSCRIQSASQSQKHSSIGQHVLSMGCSTRSRRVLPGCLFVLSNSLSICGRDPSLCRISYKKKFSHDRVSSLCCGAVSLCLSIESVITHPIPLVYRMSAPLAPVLHVSDLRQSCSSDSEHLLFSVKSPQHAEAEDSSGFPGVHTASMIP